MSDVIDGSTLKVADIKAAVDVLRHKRATVNLRDIVARVTLKNPPFPIALRVREFMGEETLEIEIQVRDRDTGAPTFVRFTEMFDSYVLRNYGEERLLTLVQMKIRDVFIHEFDECFHVDGVRVRDPHAGEK